MKDFKEDIIKIYQNERLMLIMMILNLLIALFLIIFNLVQINPVSSVIKVGYGDIGGYRDGTWTDLIAFPLLGILFGVIHNFLAVRIFHRRGAGMTKFFLVTTTALMIGTFIVLIRLIHEG